MNQQNRWDTFKIGILVDPPNVGLLDDINWDLSVVGNSMVPTTSLLDQWYNNSLMLNGSSEKT